MYRYLSMLCFCIFVLILKGCQSETFSYNDRFDERLLIKPLPSGHVYTHFQFIVQKDIEYEYEKAFHHFRLFPRSLGEVLSKYSVQELHFSLTQGLWRYEKWGYPVRSSPPGAEIWALFKGNLLEVTSNWQNLTNILSGQFCASLNFIDETNTAVPKLSLRPEGSLPLDQPYDSRFVRYSALPPEIVCTENLTPFRKLLPCGAMVGLSTLLNALNIFTANFVSQAVDVQTVCKDDNCTSAAVKLIQSVSVVFDPPVQQQGKQDWSFVKLFGSSLISTCPLASTSKVYVDISSNKSETSFELNAQPTEVILKKSSDSTLDSESYAVFDLNDMLKTARHVNIGASYNSVHIYGLVPPSVLYADRRISGYGQEQGGIRCTFYNNHPKKSFKIIYFDVIPWYLRLYSHTLIIKVGDKVIKPEYIHYQPAQDRKRPHHLELVIKLPPKSITEMSIEFDFAFLKWTEYPPDANHGFSIGAAIISTVLDSGKNFSFPICGIGFSCFNEKSKYFLRLSTQILLVSLPTPDFSMPYNVICLTCTVVALAFGPIHNITTKSLCPLSDKDDSSFVSKMKNSIKKWWSSKMKRSSKDDSAKDSTGESKEE